MSVISDFLSFPTRRAAPRILKWRIFKKWLKILQKRPFPLILSCTGRRPWLLLLLNRDSKWRNWFAASCYLVQPVNIHLSRRLGLTGRATKNCGWQGWHMTPEASTLDIPSVNTGRPGQKNPPGEKNNSSGHSCFSSSVSFFYFKCLFHLLGILSSYWWLSLDFLWSPWIQFHKRRLEYRAGGGGGGAGSEAGRHYQFLSSLISSDGWEGRRGYQGTSDAADLPTHTHASRTP